MLTESDIRLKGLRRLFEFYIAARTMDLEAIVLKMNRKVIVCDYNLFEAYVNLDGNIEVPRKAQKVIQDFLGYHELAHLVLAQIDIRFLTLVTNIPAADFREIEKWCDSFAMAMLFGRRGIALIKEENYQEFFCSPEPLDCVTEDFPAYLNRLQGGRIREEARKYFAEDSPYRTELEFLASELLADAKLKEEQSKKAAE